MTSKFAPLTQKKKWTKKEEQTAYNLYLKGHSIQTISETLNRSIPSIKNKIRRIKKQKGRGNYDKDHTIHKHILNQRYIKHIQPTSILDLYNAGNTQYNKYKVTTNDINTKYDTDYNMDSLELIQKLYNEGKQYDVVDLDPYGTAYPLLKYAIPMAKHGLIITFGELTHKRWKRLDLVSRYYNIMDYQEFTVYNMVKHIQKEALQYYGKKLEVYAIADYKYIARAYFIIKEGANKDG